MGELRPLDPREEPALDASAQRPVIEALITREALAHFLAVHPNTVDRLAKAGKIRHYRVGRAVRFRREDVEAFLAANQL